MTATEARLEDYLVRGLIDFPDINYDEHSEVLYKLAAQAVNHLRSYLKNDDEVLNVVVAHQQTLVNDIHAQMESHFQEKATAYEAHVSKGFTTMRPANYTTAAGEKARNFRVPVEDRLLIRGMLFEGFKKCLYPAQKFDVDSERRFSVILENDKAVLKWFKPAKGDMQIYYGHEQSYEPDFVVETETTKYLCEPKRASFMNADDVQAKTRAAVLWCKQATDHGGGKPWVYLLIPDVAIDESKTLAGLAAAYTVIP